MIKRREEILACARDLYLEEGLPGLSMRKVASRVGVSATAIYRHFDSKEQLVFEVIGEGFKLFGSYLYRALEGKTPLERFQLAGEAYLRFALEQSAYYEVIFMSPEQLGADSLPEDIEKQARGTFQFLVDRVQECLDAGAFKPGDAKEIAFTLWAQSHGLVSIFLEGKLDKLGLGVEGNDPKAFELAYYNSLARLFQGLLL